MRTYATSMLNLAAIPPQTPPSQRCGPRVRPMLRTMLKNLFMARAFPVVAALSRAVRCQWAESPDEEIALDFRERAEIKPPMTSAAPAPIMSPIST